MSSNVEDLETWLERVYDSGGDHAELKKLYDEWAGDYDQQLWTSGNPYIAIATGFSGRHIKNFDAAILDAGCGTGNMAQVLHQMGYQNIDGLDPSEGMLEIAFNDHGFADKIAKLESNHSWAQLDRSKLFRTYPFSDKEAHLRHWVYAFKKT